MAKKLPEQRNPKYLRLKDKKDVGTSPSQSPGIANGVPPCQKPPGLGPYPTVKVRQPTAKATPPRTLPAAAPKRRRSK